MKRHDVELRCSACGREKLATVGCFHPRCYCGGTFAVTVEHNSLGYGIQQLPIRAASDRSGDA